MRNNYFTSKASFLLLFLAPILSQSQDFEVSPVVVNFSVEPREIGVQYVTLTNHSNDKQSYTIEMYDLTYDDGGVPVANQDAGTTSNSLANWLTVSPSFVDLAPNESKTLELTLSVPATPAGRETTWALMYIKNSKERISPYADKQLATGVLISPRIRVTIVNTPKSNTKFSAAFLSIAETKKNELNQRVFKVQVQNNGGRPLNPKIFILAANLNTGKEYKQNHINFSIMPTEKKFIELPLTADLPKGEYALAVVMDYGHGSNLEVTQIMIKVE